MAVLCYSQQEKKDDMKKMAYLEIPKGMPHVFPNEWKAKPGHAS